MSGRVAQVLKTADCLAVHIMFALGLIIFALEQMAADIHRGGHGDKACHQEQQNVAVFLSFPRIRLLGEET